MKKWIGITIDEYVFNFFGKLLVVFAKHWCPLYARVFQSFLLTYFRQCTTDRYAMSLILPSLSLPLQCFRLIIYDTTPPAMFGFSVAAV